MDENSKILTVRLTNLLNCRPRLIIVAIVSNYYSYNCYRVKFYIYNLYDLN